MLVIHPESLCDVCLERYDSTNHIPHSISCGHVFCLGCLQLLERHRCPLCRSSFEATDVRRLHVDGAPRNIADCTQAQLFLRHITKVVKEGALASDVRALIQDVRLWLQTQPSDEHSELRSSYLLLYRYTELQYLSGEQQRELQELEQSNVSLKDQISTEQATAETRYAELARIRDVELEAAKEMEHNLRKQCDDVKKYWNEQLTQLHEEIRRLREQNKELKQTREAAILSSRPSETRYFYLVDKHSSNAEPLAIVKDDLHETRGVLKVQVTGKDDLFHLSPVPPSVSLPSLPTTTFKALTDDSDELDDGPRASPYLLKTIKPIDCKPSIHRMSSSSSVLMRPDDSISRSIPRTQDIIMGSCSSSPVISSMHPAGRERRSDSISSASGYAHDLGLGLRIPGTRRTSLNSEKGDYDRDENMIRVAQLYDVLGAPQSTVEAALVTKERPNVESPPTPSGKRSPVSSAASIYSAATTSPTQPSTPQPTRPTALSRASDAAAASEKARAQQYSANSPSSLAAPQLYAVREKDTTHQAFHLARPPYPRMQSSDSTRSDNIKLKSSPVVHSGIARGFRAQEAQRA
ncbi:hypothetical protein CERSUDRAFT_84613 [Gelatoporia subvermispora B]|uniref:RING-type domain-containing protein n=1 Tax=Ceriporiopsis subvermispora (strain B) TaxID=914234 RepID=M2QWF7_CERS8|nr:hypothetical protein CERSUDRAFT_84613 [Gelatoporia subvermispora B]